VGLLGRNDDAKKGGATRRDDVPADDRRATGRDAPAREVPPEGTRSENRRTAIGREVDDHDRARDADTRDARGVDASRDERAAGDRDSTARRHAAPVAVEPRRSTAAAIALTLGIIAVVLAIVPIAGVIGSLLGIIAIVIGIVGLFAARKPEVSGGGMALTGVILGVLSLILGAAGLVIFSDSASELREPVENIIEDVQEQVDGTG
jgi:hypothetical protein